MRDEVDPIARLERGELHGESEWRQVGAQLFPEGFEVSLVDEIGLPCSLVVQGGEDPAQSMAQVRGVATRFFVLFDLTAK